MGKATSAVLDAELTALDNDRAMFSAESAESDPDATADISAISVVVLSVMSPVLLLLVNAEANAR